MKIAQLKEIQAALTAWSKKPSSLSYQIAKNLGLVNKKVKETDEAFDEAKKGFVELNEKGEPKTFWGNNFGVPLKEFDPAKETPAGGVQIVLKINDEVGFKKLRKEYDEDEIDIAVHKIAESKINDEVEKGTLEAAILVPLIGTIIVLDSEISK